MNPLSFRYLGVLPYSYNERGEFVILLGQEKGNKNAPDEYKWGSFGGGPEKKDKEPRHLKTRVWVSGADILPVFFSLLCFCRKFL